MQSPTVGRVVLIRHVHFVGVLLAGIVAGLHPGSDAVQSDKPGTTPEPPGLINVIAFDPNGNPMPLTSVQHVDAAPEGASATWEWPEIFAAASPLASVEPGEMYGGLNVLGLLGGDFGAIVGPLLVMLYNANRERIATGAERIMTPPASAVDYVCDRLGIEGSERSAVEDAVHAWGKAGASVLTAIADAKAGS